MEFGATIRDNRRRLGITQSQLAMLSGVSEKTLGEIERGSTAVQLSSLLKVLSSLGIELTFSEAPEGTASGN